MRNLPGEDKNLDRLAEVRDDKSSMHSVKTIGFPSVALVISPGSDFWTGEWLAHGDSYPVNISAQFE